MTKLGPDLFADADLEGPVAEVARQIAVEGFLAIWSGDEVVLSELVATEPVVLAAAVEHLLGRGRLEVSAEGRLIAVHGLSSRTTRHRIEHTGGVVHTWCALDAIGIPAALAIDARAVTDCLTCAAAVEVVLTAGVPQSRPEARLWYPEGCGSHLVEDFCSGANLFCSVAHLEEWADRLAVSGAAMTVEDVAEMGYAGWAVAANHLRARAGEPSLADRSAAC